MNHLVIDALYYSYKPSIQSKTKLYLQLQVLEKQLKNMNELERLIYILEHQKKFITLKNKLPFQIPYFDPSLPIDIPTVFIEFIKGITYFSYETESSIYNRLQKFPLEYVIFANIYKRNTKIDLPMPDIDCKIHIKYIQNIPTVLSIIKKSNNKIRSVEVYSKDGAIVKCIITKRSGVYIRFNTFDKIGRICDIRK